MSRLRLSVVLFLTVLLSACASSVQDEPEAEPPAPTHALDYADGFGLLSPGPEDRARWPRCDHFLDVRWLKRVPRHPYRRKDSGRRDRGYWVGKAHLRVQDLRPGGAASQERELVVLQHRASPGSFSVFDMSAENARTRGEALDQLLLQAEKIANNYKVQKTDDEVLGGLRVTIRRRHMVLKEGVDGAQRRREEGLVAPTLGLTQPVPDGRRVCIRSPEAADESRRRRRSFGDATME